MFAIFPEILQVAQRGDLETLACLVRKYFGDRQIYAPRLRLEPLLGSLGISLSRENAPFFARLQIIDVKGQYHVAITLDARIHDPGEVNFTIAHLLGYFFIALQPLMARGELSAQAYQLETGALARLLSPASAQSRTPRSPQSLAADGFAQSLLMPVGMVKKAHEKLGSKQDLAGFFQVKPELMLFRLKNLGLHAGKREEKLAPRPSPSAPPPAVHAQAAPVRKPPQAPLAGLSPGPAKSLPPSVLPSARAKGTGQEDSIARVQKSVAKLGYQKEEQRAAASDNEDKLTNSKQGGGEGLKRLRELAKKIDRSVDV